MEEILVIYNCHKVHASADPSILCNNISSSGCYCKSCVKRSFFLLQQYLNLYGYIPTTGGLFYAQMLLHLSFFPLIWSSSNLNAWPVLFLIGNILGANQPLRVNYGNFNLGHRINIQRKGRRGVGGGFAKVWLPNPRAGPDCKMTQSPMPLGCWSDDTDWSFYSLHEEIGLHFPSSWVWTLFH